MWLLLIHFHYCIVFHLKNIPSIHSLLISIKCISIFPTMLPSLFLFFPTILPSLFIYARVSLRCISFKCVCVELLGHRLCALTIFGCCQIALKSYCTYVCLLQHRIKNSSLYVLLTSDMVRLKYLRIWYIWNQIKVQFKFEFPWLQLHLLIYVLNIQCAHLCTACLFPLPVCFLLGCSYCFYCFGWGHKYFGLYGPHCLDQTYSTLPL